MSDIAFSMTADEKDVLRGLQAVGKEQGKLRDQIASLVTSSKEAGAQEATIASSRIKALDAIVGKQKTLKGQMAELEAQLKSGKITSEQYKDSFDAIGRESNELAGQLRRLRAQVAEDTDDFKKATQVADKYETKTEQVTRAIANLNRMKVKGAIDSKQHAAAVAAENAKLTEGGNAAGFFGSKLGTLAAGFVGITAVVATVREEYDRLIERQNKSATAQIGLAAAQEKALANLGQDPTLSSPELFKTIRDKSQTLGMNERELTLAVSDALSARGNASAKEAVDAVVASAKLQRFSPDQLPELSASALDISKGTGLSHEESLGFLLQTGTLSRVTDMSKLSKNVAPAIVGGMQFGASREFAGATTAALTQGIVDPTGETSRTAMTSLFKQMREFGKSDFVGGAALEQQMAEVNAEFERRKTAVSKSDTKDKPGQVRELKQARDKQLEQLAAAVPEMSVEQVFARLQSDKKFKADFFKAKDQGGFAASFEAKALPAIEGLLTRGSVVSNQFEGAFGALKTQDPGQRFRDTVKQRDELPAAQVAIAEQQFKNLTDQLRLSDPKQAISGVVRSGLKDVRDTLGESGIGTRIAGVLDDLGTGGKQTLPSAIAALESEKAGIKFGQRQAIPSFGAVSNEVRERKLSAEDSKTLELLERQIQQLEQLNAIMTQQADATKQKQHAGVVAGRADAQKEGAR